MAPVRHSAPGELVPDNPWFYGGLPKRAHEGQGYFLTDSSTWVMEKGGLPGLKVLFQGDPVLINAYHGLSQPPGVTPGAELGGRFLDFLASDRGQQIIRDFGKDRYGQGLYQGATGPGGRSD